SSSSSSSDNWIYLGLGGFLDPWSISAIVNTFNPWVYNKVATMRSEKFYYPMGIVLLNQVASTDKVNASYSYNVGPDVMKQILRLNQRYKMKSNPDYNAGVRPTFPSSAPGYDSGYSDNGADAI
ncbi:MAG: hypothetical protein HUJ91_07920, partial [Bacteroidales bacterium]|nr:hypothetical protein [Bacteroidales bacterium]